MNHNPLSARSLLTCSFTSPRIIDKLNELIDSRFASLKEELTGHITTVGQKVSNLPTSFNAVQKSIDKCTTEQNHTQRTLKDLHIKQQATQQNVGHVHDLVSNIWKQNKDVSRLGADTEDLRNMLLQMNLERKASLSQIADSEAMLQEVTQERDALLDEVDRLKEVISNLRLQRGYQAVAESTARQLGIAPPNLSDPWNSAIDYKIKRKY